MNDQWNDLISAVLDGSPSPEVAAQVNAWIKEDPANVRRFVRDAILHSHLRDMLDGAEAFRRDEEDRRSLLQSESMVLPAIIEEPATDQETEADEPTHEPAEEQLPPPQAARWNSLMRSLLRPRWQLIAAAIVPLLLAIGIYRLVHSPQRFATLTASYDAQWDTSGGAPKPGGAIPSELLYLRSGVAGIKYESGATMIVEGPARFQIRSANAVELTFGKATAVVPPPAHGFTIEAGSSRVVDLGTEFGVEVSEDGSDAIQVFKGSVRVEPRIGNSSTTLMLTEGQAANATGIDLKLDPAGAQPQKFVRQLGGEPAALDLVDLISGGDGTTHRSGMAIDYARHALGTFEPVEFVKGDYQYHRVSGSLVVDGCFIPDGAKGPVEVNSIGQRHLFPRTQNAVYNQIWTGGPIRGVSKYPPVRTVLGGIDYAAPPHSILFMSSNGGLTIDLAAIRRLHPTYLLKRLQCVVGNSDAAGKIRPLADVYVLLGDKLVFEQRKFDNRRAPFTVDVPLDPAERFLTFAVTDGGDGTSFDAILWTDAKLIGETR